jgi:hypothetical protein
VSAFPRPGALARGAIAALVFGVGLGVAGCGYSTGLGLPPDERTIGVEFFHNDSPQRDIEKDLQSELAQSVERMVRAPLVSPERSDLVVRGRIVGYSRRGGIRSPDNELLETGVRITVEARLVRPLAVNPEGQPLLGPDGKPMVGPDGKALTEQVIAFTRFTSESGYRLEEIDGERAARARVLRNIADRLALDLFSPLAYEAAPK